MVAVRPDPLRTMGPANAAHNDIRLGVMVNRYSPRGSPQGIQVFVDEVLEALRKQQPPIPAATLSGPPLVTQVELDFPKATLEEVAQEHTVRLAAFQDLNTRMWDVIFPSVDLTGAYQDMDRALVKQRFMVGELRDGYGLMEWIKEITATDPVTDQITAVKALNDCKTLDGSKVVTLVHLDIFLSQFITKWLGVAGNSTNTEQRMIEFRARLLAVFEDGAVGVVPAGILASRDQRLVDHVGHTSAEDLLPANGARVELHPWLWKIGEALWRGDAVVLEQRESTRAGLLH